MHDHAVRARELEDSSVSESASAGLKKQNVPISRRAFVAGTCVVAGGAAGGALYRWTEGWGWRDADVFIGRIGSYADDIRAIVQRGLAEIGVGRSEVQGKSILLKPNLVEPAIEAPHINTHPAFVLGVADAFLGLDAREVFVAEGPGHCSDTFLVLDESGMGKALQKVKIEFVDLNHDDIDRRPNRSRRTRMAELFLPRSLRRADLVVSLPKMKTHHWTGATLSMKNFFGAMPGVCYGWPKNVLHHQGIHESIVDIVATIRPHLAIVDGIIGMEGDGPIMGTPKAAGLIVMGKNLPAVDATCCRLMGLSPENIGYLAASSGHLGPIAERNITQRGEKVAACAQRFELADHPELTKYRA